MTSLKYKVLIRMTLLSEISLTKTSYLTYMREAKFLKELPSTKKKKSFEIQWIYCTYYLYCKCIVVNIRHTYIRLFIMYKNTNMYHLTKSLNQHVQIINNIILESILCAFTDHHSFRSIWSTVLKTKVFKFTRYISVSYPLSLFPCTSFYCYFNPECYFED